MDPSNPYDAPRANLLELRVDGDDPDFLGEPRALPAGNAVRWFEQGWQLFTQAPGMWIAVFLLYAIVLLISGCIPFAQNLLAPVFNAGVAIGADKLRRGEDFGVDALFDGFRSEHVGQLVLIGLFTLLATFALVLVLLPLNFILIAGIGATQQGGGSDAAAIIPMVLFFLLILAVSLPLAMATAFAPLLVAFHGMTALDAMKLSLRGCWVNIGGALLWALIAVVVFIVAMLPLLLGLLVAFPLLMAVNYAAYRDIFYRG